MNIGMQLNPIFDYVETVKKIMAQEWSEIGADKSENVYVPLLQAFMDEVNRANEERQDICQEKMIEYLNWNRRLL